MAYIRKVKTKSGATAVQIAYTVYGKTTAIDHIGSAHNIAEIKLLESVARSKLMSSQTSLLEEPPVSTAILLKQSVSDVLYNTLLEQYCCLGFNQLNDDDFANLVIGRLVEPTSKLDTVRVLADLGLNLTSEDRLQRCLKRIITNNYRDRLAKLCFAHALQHSGISLVLYDVTTLYFEIQKEDEGDANAIGYRKPGMSKERRLDPQIIVGLLVDQNGFPLELHSFEGNKAETKTILPVIEQFKARHGLLGITVVADAGMLSTANLEELTSAGYTYIVGSRLAKIPYDIAQFAKTGRQLQDNQIITAETAIPGQRIIYQYRAKRASLDMKNIDKQIEKAKRIISGKTTAKKTKFLNAKTKEKSLNQTLVDKAKTLAGIKGYVTNLPKAETSDERIIAYYHQLWHVEQSFRMSKHDLRARPIFHHLKDSIEAHLTVVMASLAIARTIQNKTGLSIRRFVRQLKTIRSGIVVIEGKEYPAKAVIPEDVDKLLQKLKRTH